MENIDDVLDRSALRQLQWAKLSPILKKLASAEGFYRSAMDASGSLTGLEDFVAKVPLTTKEALLEDRMKHPPFGSHFLAPLDRFTRFCLTSGTSTGQPMAWIDTQENWEAMLECWHRVYKAAGLEAGRDRIYFAFSFGPFLGFWTAFDAASQIYLSFPGGGQSSKARLEQIARYQATVLCCTPTYALRLGELIGAKGSDIQRSDLGVRKIIVAGEPGGGLPSVRSQIERVWGARVLDHHGMTEVGPVTYEDLNHPGGLMVIEESFLAEVIDPATGVEVEEGASGELVLTTLDRAHCPILRYRTGDWVKKTSVNGRLYLEGGILSRIDDMRVVRGVNIYPAAIENVVREFAEVQEFMVEESTAHGMNELKVLIESKEESVVGEIAARLESRLRDVFCLRIEVQEVPFNTLPRHEFKSKRWRRV